MNGGNDFLIFGLTPQPIEILLSPIITIGRFGGGADIQLPGRLRSIQAIVVRESTADNKRWNYRLIPLLEAPVRLNQNVVIESSSLNRDDKISFDGCDETLVYKPSVAGGRSARFEPHSRVASMLRSRQGDQISVAAAMADHLTFAPNPTGDFLVNDLPKKLTLTCGTMRETRERTDYWKCGLPPLSQHVSQATLADSDYRKLQQPDCFAVTTHGIVETSSLKHIDEISQIQELSLDFVSDKVSLIVTVRPLKGEENG